MFEGAVGVGRGERPRCARGDGGESEPGVYDGDDGARSAGKARGSGAAEAGAVLYLRAEGVAGDAAAAGGEGSGGGFLRRVAGEVAGIFGGGSGGRRGAGATGWDGGGVVVRLPASIRR